MKEIASMVFSAIGWCVPFLVNWAIMRFGYKDKNSSSVFLLLTATALGCHLCAIITVLCWHSLG